MRKHNEQYGNMTNHRETTAKQRRQNEMASSRHISGNAEQ